MLIPGPLAAARAVARAMAQLVGPPEAPDAAPPWLRPEQVQAFRQALAVLRRHRACLCAAPVGTGKTYIALAVAGAWGFRTTCIVPAALMDQWRHTARRLNIDLDLWSHERVSRGAVPTGEPCLVIVDESHQFRNPATKRYRTLAPWLLGRALLLLTGTPAVNRTADLFHQLHLGLRDDALSLEGVASLRLALGAGNAPSALASVIVTSGGTLAKPGGRHTSETPRCGTVPLLPALDTLALSSDPAIAALVRLVLLRSAASSPAALLTTLRRYQALLAHARDARTAGRPLNRRALLQFTRGAAAQLVFWELLAPVLDGSELVAGDLAQLDLLLPRAARLSGRKDGKASRLLELLEDRATTIVFTGARETIGYLRRHLGDPWLAWCTGSRAGIGRTELPRADVLRWFRPGRLADQRHTLPGAPRTLVTTDVAAEGLDLQAAARVVHYDLPWTAIRLDQRDGRAVRLGSPHAEVEVIRFEPTRAIERRLRILDRLGIKALLPSRLGLASGARDAWRWRSELTGAIGGGPASNGTARVRSSSCGCLVGIALVGPDDRHSGFVVWRDAAGRWTDEPRVIEGRIAEASLATEVAAIGSDTPIRPPADLAELVRARLRVALQPGFLGTPASEAGRRLITRLRRLAGHGIRARDAALTSIIQAALRFAAGGHTAGEEMLVENLLALDDAGLQSRIHGLPAANPPPTLLVPQLVGIILFEADCPAHRGTATLPGCRASGPCCSISTER
ncbi:MAG TPA: helicase-related protein [Gemmatimonadales bacterium]|nr:helicase-related protein [Gemmatimonadales bacterium]